jgi:hypothetical protein
MDRRSTWPSLRSRLLIDLVRIGHEDRTEIDQVLFALRKLHPAANHKIELAGTPGGHPSDLHSTLSQVAEQLADGGVGGGRQAEL